MPDDDKWGGATGRCCDCKNWRASHRRLDERGTCRMNPGLTLAGWEGCGLFREAVEEQGALPLTEGAADA
jgi:hypothetical protein